MLAIENLAVAYPDSADWALRDISLILERGEKMGLVGESGCGKSTLGRAVLRLLPQGTWVEGRALFEGQSVFELEGEKLRRFRGEAVGLVFQDPMTRLDPLMTIGEHCLETLRAHRPDLDGKVAQQIALETLERVKIPPTRWGQYAHEFSGGMRQRVAMALALLLKPKLILADEPTTALDVTVAAEILGELTRLCAEDNMSLLLISHDLAMVGAYCDRVAVMNGGAIVETAPMQTLLTAPQHPYTQSLLESALHIHNLEQKKVFNSDNAPPLLQVKNLRQQFSLEGNLIEQLFRRQKSWIKAVDNVSLEIYPGETLGLVGESGCGKSTFSRTVLQLLPAASGEIWFDGEELTRLSPAQMQGRRRQLQMIFQDPGACLNPKMTVGDSIADPLFIHQLASPQEAEARVKAMLERVKLTPTEDYYHRYPKELSGGQQQRVAIARALITQPKLVICDEPVSMLDASVQSQVLELMQDLKDSFNLTYLFITHDLWVARFFCDRIAVMTQGQIVEMGPTERIFRQPQHSYTQK
ncbi:MAG: dipeptide ABC transporter ATP-binding protein, partial [Cyanobacteriota bacterium]